MAKYLIVSNRIVDHTMAVTLVRRGILNVASVFLDSKGLINVQVMNSFKKTAILIKSPRIQNISSRLFPDKLKNLHGYKHRLIMLDKSIVKSKPGQTRIKSRLFNLMNVSGSIQNTSFTALRIKDSKTYDKIFSNRSVTLSMNTVPARTDVQQLMSYDMSGLCVVLPISPKKSFFRGTLFKPFSSSTKIGFICSTIAGTLTWRLFKVSLN